MGTRQPKRRGRPRRVTDKQRVWINEYLTDMNGARAARVAGFKHPDVAAAKLLNAGKYPLVAAEVRKALARKELEAERKADDVLRYIHTAMWFCPADYFDPGGNGGWLISREDYRELPPAIKCLVEEMELRTVRTKRGTASMLWVRFVSKSKAMTLAAKHQLGQKVNMHQTVTLDWDALCGASGADATDPVEEMLAALEALPVNRLAPPSTNGHA
ncbi:MAG: terminase small subunit [Gaiellaceae bacterium]